MNEPRPPRPRAFRLDDKSVSLDDALAPSRPAPPAPPPDPPRPAAPPDPPRAAPPPDPPRPAPPPRPPDPPRSAAPHDPPRAAPPPDPPRPAPPRPPDPPRAAPPPRPPAPTAVVIRAEAKPIPPRAQSEPIDAGERDIETAQDQGMRRRWRPSLGAVAAAGFGGLVSLTLGLWADELLEGLFARAAALGWIGVAFAALFAAGLVGLATREIVALARQTGIAELHAALARARAADDRAAARALVARLIALYEKRPETAKGRADTAAAARDIIDGRDLVDIAERALIRPLDLKARAEIATAAKRVSVVTAISPRAVFDVLFVVAQTIRLVRKIAEIYGGRPGLLGFFRLSRSILAHLAITGGMAVGDSLLQQLVGHGLASKISARMGEGVLNGLLTARVGLSALAVCRPAPFGVAKPPGVADVAPFLFSGNKEP